MDDWADSDWVIVERATIMMMARILEMYHYLCLFGGLVFVVSFVGSNGMIDDELGCPEGHFDHLGEELCGGE